MKYESYPQFYRSIFVVEHYVEHPQVTLMIVCEFFISRTERVFDPIEPVANVNSRISILIRGLRFRGEKSLFGIFFDRCTYVSILWKLS